MKVTNTYKNLSKQEQEIFDNYIPSKLKQINGLLQKFQEDAVLLDCTIEKFDKHDAYSVELILKMPMKTLKAKETSHTILKAIDLSKDRMIIQIKKLIDTIQKEQLQARRHASIRRPKVHEEVAAEDIHTKQFLEA
ncbi:hypothetical protein HOG17_04245 [Candidatus Peregrinibacteria bacterium]|jgi:ribosome-associated translation inhibitor RaiA|nr:hypothetical protein [Candidatus Peregrinibacteria bacterium]MBT4147978.1 hypothetical protein [Candidatus Peregrinibacteria bacterium]MBT4366115.1 hypothetical protein [Candidatus Peregrinibacteria bacterium]MBT4456227.1 hypothetical protein [Candidatus Peregrinibacteria bacterium]